MTVVTLTIRNAAGRQIGSVGYVDGRPASVLSIERGLNWSLTEWLTRGLFDWTGTGLEARRRFTPPQHPEFLERLRNHIEQQTGLRVSLRRTLMKTMYAITHVNDDGVRTLTLPNQGRYHYATREEAERSLKTFIDVGDLRAKVLHDKADTLAVMPVECYDHGDAIGIYFDPTPADIERMRFRILTDDGRDVDVLGGDVEIGNAYVSTYGAHVSGRGVAELLIGEHCIKHYALSGAIPTTYKILRVK